MLRRGRRPQPHDGLRAANPLHVRRGARLVQEVRALGKRACTFNAAYAQEQLDFLFGYFERLHEAGAAGVIVSVPEAVQAAADCGLAVVASTMCGVYNADIARFYRRLGCTRVIIPRDVSLDEIEAIVRAVPGVEYEAFVMRNGCV
ncbi:MAG: U32 family peptidase, partial [Eggerthellaceae bacterium]